MLEANLTEASFNRAFVAAARYPQVVALTRLLASPYWMDLALRDHIAAGRPNEAYREHLVKAVYITARLPGPHRDSSLMRSRHPGILRPR